MRQKAARLFELVVAVFDVLHSDFAASVFVVGMLVAVQAVAVDVVHDVLEVIFRMALAFAHLVVKTQNARSAVFRAVVLILADVRGQGVLYLVDALFRRFLTVLDGRLRFLAIADDGRDDGYDRHQYRRDGGYDLHKQCASPSFRPTGRNGNHSIFSNSCLIQQVSLCLKALFGNHFALWSGENLLALVGGGFGCGLCVHFALDSAALYCAPLDAVNVERKLLTVTGVGTKEVELPLHLAAVTVLVDSRLRFSAQDGFALRIVSHFLASYHFCKCSLYAICVWYNRIPARNRDGCLIEFASVHKSFADTV